MPIESCARGQAVGPVPQTPVERAGGSSPRMPTRSSSLPVAWAPPRTALDRSDRCGLHEGTVWRAGRDVCRRPLHAVLHYHRCDVIAASRARLCEVRAAEGVSNVNVQSILGDKGAAVVTVATTSRWPTRR